MNRVFCIVGPTATGKSALAADVAVRLGGEIVSADAFQIYAGFDLLSAKPDKRILHQVPHHLIGAVRANERMSAARYRALAMSAIGDISSRGKVPLLVGGSGLYVKALTHGLLETAGSEPQLRRDLNELAIDQLRKRLTDLDPVAAETVDLNNRRRVVRAIEIALLGGKPASLQRTQWKSAGEKPSRAVDSFGVFVFRDREELYQRINQRVEAILRDGALEEVRSAGQVSTTVDQMIGIQDIRQYLRGEISLPECVAKIQQATRRYAKRQLTWFRHQTNFVPLNLSLLSHNEAVQWVSRRAIAGRAVND